MSRAVKRKYHSSIRAEQARTTRARVLAAAQKLFRQRGYAATSIAEIARAANVSAETIYVAFGSKRELLAQMVAVAIAGKEEEVPLLQRAWVERMRREPNQVQRLRYWTHHTSETLERTSAIHALVREAVASEPELAKLRTEQQRYRLSMQKALMRLIEESGRKSLRFDAEKAGETFWILASPELHHLLRVDRGWSKARYRAWLTEALETLLINSHEAERSREG